MKYIEKRKPPESLERYKETAGANFDDLPSNVKSELKQQLADEQGDICCYCGKRISPDHHSVIEHLLPKGDKRYTHLQLVYSNLVCSCDGGEQERTGRPKRKKKLFPSHCDDKKNNSIIPVTPLDENVESLFSYVPYKIGKLQIQGFSEPITSKKIKQSYHITQKAARSRQRAAFLRGKLGRRQKFSKK